jgi:hypothetical protein
MKKIEVDVSRFWFFTKKYKSFIPESWAEINASQLIALGEMYLHKNTQLNLISKFTGIPLRVVKQLSDIEIFYILKEIEFIKDFRPRNCFIIQKLSCLECPRPKLDGMSWGQFMFVDSYYEQFMGQQNDENLNVFIAHLYGFNNEVFDHSLSKRRAEKKIIKSIPYEVKFAVSINYRLIREWLAVTYPLVFNKHEDVTPVSEANQQRVQQNPWLKIHNALVGDDLINYENYAKQQLHVILRYLTEKIKANARKKH